MRVMLEIGPKGKKVVAWAPEWPGLERGASTGEDAIERLRAYLPRYARVAGRARMAPSFDADASLSVAAEYPGVGSTDFWGISFASCDEDRQPVSDGEWDRRLQLLQACWADFDEVAARVSPKLAKGPRGGGRDRDDIIAHTFGTERTQMARKVGVRTPEGVMLTLDGLRTHRREYIDALQETQRRGEIMVGRSWTLSYLLRHTAYHIMDHAWEMEDKDLSESQQV